jgi:hypothetical protein
MVSQPKARPRCGAAQAANGNERPASTPLEIRRREIKALLEEIQSHAPTPTDIIQVVEQASNGELSGDRLERITAGILSLYKVR